METSREAQIERFQRAFFTLFKKLGPELGLPDHITLTGPQTMMLYTISQMGPCPAGKLAGKMEVTPSAITVMIDRLVQNGFVERKHDELDRRIVLLQATDKGKEVLKELNKLRTAAIHTYLSHVEADELELFLTTFEKIVKKIEE
ncbi:MarR family transcriptional regulator [Paenibacillus validus]|uniref:MarR family transcriptional regulator n=1 Tax=Paenibacillus validus TaxID=44253 RepID=A0A7X2ZFS1_9BACL|nr:MULTISPECIES: MarR family transcriptional regulator [Paenibacillus]MED4603432.1 MarR family transcriptional regulator [Paenibacillus validus]MED4608405.1 MarR family transcriptional regulator [Paenibacillus validus]MUG73433.1 MarR family transcriptional regulator [Paenibacillus validus]